MIIDDERRQDGGRCGEMESLLHAAAKYALNHTYSFKDKVSVGITLSVLYRDITAHFSLFYFSCVN